MLKVLSDNRQGKQGVKAEQEKTCFQKTGMLGNHRDCQLCTETLSNSRSPHVEFQKRAIEPP
jgi:hypothetical protein